MPVLIQAPGGDQHPPYAHTYRNANGNSYSYCQRYVHTDRDGHGYCYCYSNCRLLLLRRLHQQL